MMRTGDGKSCKLQAQQRIVWQLYPIVLLCLLLVIDPVAPKSSVKKAIKTGKAWKKNLEEMTDTVGNVLDKLNSGMDAALQGLETLEGVLDATKDTECRHKCPANQKLKRRPGYTPSANGCGSYGLKLDMTELPDFEECCTKHDHCYDKCGAKRQLCDTEFHECLHKACKSMFKKRPLKEMATCKTGAEMIYAGAHALGCKAFLDSQKEACICARDEL